MNEKNPVYKIGDVARILGISVDLIRYYEEKGVVSPTKNPDNNYREYDTWDINYLIDCLWYKHFGYGIEQISHMVSDYDYPMLLDSLEDKSHEIEREIKKQQRLLERIERFREKLSDTRARIGQCEVLQNAPYYYYINRRGDEYDSGEKTRELSRRWLEYMPFTRRYFEISPESVLGTADEYEFGFSVRDTYAKEFGIEQKPPVQYMPPKLCIHSAFKSTGRTHFSARNIDYMREYAQSQGYKPAGGAFGNLACSIIEDGEQTGYFEVWLPVT